MPIANDFGLPNTASSVIRFRGGSCGCRSWRISFIRSSLGASGRGRLAFSNQLDETSIEDWESYRIPAVKHRLVLDTYHHQREYTIVS